MILFTKTLVNSRPKISTGDLHFLQECSSFSQLSTSSRSSPLPPGRMSDFLQPHNSVCFHPSVYKTTRIQLIRKPEYGRKGVREERKEGKKENANKQKTRRQKQQNRQKNKDKYKSSDNNDRDKKKKATKKIGGNEGKKTNKQIEKKTFIQILRKKKVR